MPERSLLLGSSADSEPCAHEVPRELAEGLLLPRCVKCGQALPEVARAIAEQYEREQRQQEAPVPGEHWRADVTGKPPPPGSSPDEVRRWRRHQRMKQRGQADQIGYRGG